MVLALLLETYSTQHPLLLCALIHPLPMSLPGSYNILVVPILFPTKSAVGDLAKAPWCQKIPPSCVVRLPASLHVHCTGTVS
jgi:hypothetical protein